MSMPAEEAIQLDVPDEDKTGFRKLVTKLQRMTTLGKKEFSPESEPVHSRE